MDAPLPKPAATDDTAAFPSTPYVALLAVTALVILFYNLGGQRTFGSHEVFAAVPARAMLETGDFVVPYQAGVPRLQKPPLAYWVICGSATLWGGVDEFSARFPAACFATLLALLTGYWAAKWYGRRAGIFAAFIQATPIYVLIFGRKSEIDMCITLLTTACLFLIANQPAGQRWREGFLRWSAVFALLGVSMLAKFHYGPAMVLTPCVVYWLVEKRYRDVQHLFNPAGWLLMLAPLAIWAWQVVERLPGAIDVWKAETVDRASGNLDQDPIWFFLPHILSLFLPWTPLALLALRGSWRKAWRDRDPQERFLWVWFLTQLAIVSLQPGKQKHYINSALPALALLSGRYLATVLTPERWLGFRWNRWQTAGLLVGSAASGVAVAAIVGRMWPWLQTPGIALGTVLGGGLAISTILNRLHRPALAYGTVVVAALALQIVFTGWILPGRDHWRAQAEFSRRVRDLAQDETVTGYQLSYSPLYYLGSNVRNRLKPNELQETLRERGRLLVVAFEEDQPDLAQLGDLVPRLEMTAAEKQLAGDDPHLKCWELTARPPAADLATRPDPTGVQ